MREKYDTGIPWIGEIPIGWRFTKLGRICSIITDGTHQTPNYIEEGYPFISIKDISSGKIDFSDVKYISEEEHKALYAHAPVKRGDILFTRIGTLGVFVEVETDRIFDFFVSVGMLRLKPDVINKHYLLHYLNSPAVENFIQAIKAGFGTAAPKYNLTDVNKTWVLLPTVKEQMLIADFLDSKCAEIDTLSADIQSEIDTLDAYKHSVITEAVTKGLDKNVPMKDSGIEWVGEIPESWEIVNIKRIYDRSHRYPLGDGDHGMIKPADYIEEGVPYIRVQNLGFCTDLKIDNIVYISAEKNNRIKSSTLRPNDVLFAKTGATIGKTGIVPETMPIANTTSHVGKITVSKEYNPRYIYYVLSSYIGYKQFWDIASLKSTRPELSIEETKRLLFTVPKSKDIQDKIVDYLDNVCKDIDLIIVQKQEQLTVLAEYKKSIIYEYVTGKKEVPVT